MARRVLPYALAQADIAGAVVVLVKDRQAGTQRRCGYFHVAARKPVDPATTMFWPGPISRLYTWTAVMQMVEDGKIDLDTDINQYLDFPIPLCTDQPITMRNDTTLRPAFEPALNHLIVFKGSVPSLGEAPKQRLPKRVFAPGTTGAYSNDGVGLAGYIVERVSGMPFEDYIDREVFAPLGTTHAPVRQPPPVALAPFIASRYRVASADPAPYEIFTLPPAGSAAVPAVDRSAQTLRPHQGSSMRALPLFLAVGALLGSGLVIGGCAEQKPLSADARIQALYSAEWKWREDQFPDEEDAAKPVQDHFPKMDAAAQDARLHYWQDVLATLKAIPRAELSADEQLNYDIYRPQIEALIAAQRFREFEMPVNADTTFWTQVSYTARRPFRTEQEYKNWIGQMRDLPRYFHEQTELMRAGLKRGFTPPRVTITGLDASLTAVTSVAPEASLLYTPFKEMPGIPAATQATLRADAIAVIHGSVQPAYEELLKFMRTEYVPGARQSLGAKNLPDGQAYYQSKIREFTTLDMDPDAIHALGETEVARLHQEMLAAMRETGFKGDLPAFLKFLRSDPKFAAKTPEELLMRAAWIAKKFDGKASRYFGYLPRARFAIEPVPAEMAPFYTAGRGGPTLYLVNTYNVATRPLFNLTALTLHESAPGHSFQLSITMEHKKQPEFRQHTYISAYGEGWALYCEHLGVEMGMYETPYDRFGMLGYQMWRAARLVVDTGIHSQGWTRERAVAYFREYTALPEHEIGTEIDRYISWPGQALSYYLGELSIVKIRAKAEQALGPKFNIRAFHDAILELGSVPLPILEARMDRFIADGGKGPYPDLE